VEKKRKIIPAVYLLASLVTMALLQVFVPVFQFVEPPLAYMGIVPVIFGIIVAAISAGKFKKADTGIIPFDEASTLVISGFYRFSRNPMYMGMFLMLLGVAFLLGSVGAFLPVPVFVLVIRNNFVLGEERFLEATFGQPYLDYKSAVRRWF
jgi:protein-S-isoprenylcysteine O-methyltransferase Ste14